METKNPKFDSEAKKNDRLPARPTAPTVRVEMTDAELSDLIWLLRGDDNNFYMTAELSDLLERLESVKAYHFAPGCHHE